MIIKKPGDAFVFDGMKYVIGELIVGTKQSEYEGLFGIITEIRDGEDKDTENETPDLYCTFENPALPSDVKRLEKVFSELYEEPKTIEDIILDEVIMAPEMIISLSELSHNSTEQIVFAVLEDWAVDDETGNKVEIYSEEEEAKLVLRRKVRDEKAGGCLRDWTDNDWDFKEESSDNSYSGYLDGFYNSDHYSVTVFRIPMKMTSLFAKKEMETVASNMRPECAEKDCYICSYFHHATAYCSAADEIKDCAYCKNAFTDERLDKHSDLSYLSIGSSPDNFSAFICSSAEYQPPVSIIVQEYREDLKRNVDVVRYTPTYCPICGRKIIENKQFLKEFREKKHNKDT